MGGDKQKTRHIQGDGSPSKEEEDDDTTHLGILADIVKAGDVEPELPGLCELAKTCAEADQLVPWHIRRLQHNPLTVQPTTATGKKKKLKVLGVQTHAGPNTHEPDIINPVIMETEAVGLISTVNKVSNVGSNA